MNSTGLYYVAEKVSAEGEREGWRNKEKRRYDFCHQGGGVGMVINTIRE